jgi:hypothetical protein
MRYPAIRRARRRRSGCEQRSNGKMSTSAEKGAKIFEEHFKALYECKPPEYDLAVLAKIAQRKLRRGLDSESALEEVQKAVKALKASGPGRLGVSAAEWKSIMADTGCDEGWVVQYVNRFWLKSKRNLGI